MAEETIIVHTEKRDDGIAIVYINGNIITNLSGTSVRAEIEALLKAERPRIILNIHDVRYLDSYSFGWLAKVQKDAIAKGGKFAVSNPNDEINDLMQMLKFDKTVPVFASEEDASADFKG